MKTHNRLAGKVAVVTGGTAGIGQGIVLRFLREGAKVVYCSRTPGADAENKAIIVADIPGAAERAHFIVADVGVEDQVRGVVREAVTRFGKLDILVCNAQGIAQLRSIEDKPDSDYEMVHRTGFYQTLWCMKEALPYLKQSGNGRIVTFSSHWNLFGQFLSSDYNTTKASIESLTRSAAKEWGGWGITANCILPAGDSRAYKTYKNQSAENIALAAKSDAARPMGRMGDCERDVAAAVLGLCSDHARFITGQVFGVDGGAWLSTSRQKHKAGTEIHAGRTQTAA
ncbi:NAD(P)-dependent dehydrogenase (short-subunit alcohol dehydrogenase family) [Sphingobium sp. AEW010]|nr:NAD(P)-dependent dehydrogenase (short-subunit alcohol dehydrogenase family) [Sphingobium sp. AEW010]TWD23312.1 NAD(P)-dependent dehydrogenase (short-subunit alcohol dehydrogenase family) [Sphingobium sp. AEW013]TWD25172.1 NAD(P)-dependent dehydrogenase (short-subunit alcohol dehydrogenase family) [Sphingobium sp. AEW001]